MSIQEEATFIVGISQGHDIKFVVASIPAESGCVEQKHFVAGEVSKDLGWPTLTLTVRGTRQQSLIIFNALASQLDEPEFSDEE